MFLLLAVPLSRFGNRIISSLCSSFVLSIWTYADRSMTCCARYAIGGDKDDWAVAQAQIASRVGTEGGLTNVLSVKNPLSTKMSSIKRKAEESKKREGSSKKGKKSSGGDRDGGNSKKSRK